MLPNNDWVSRNGIYLPPGLAKNLDSAMNSGADRGKFFSNYVQSTQMAGQGGGFRKPGSEISFDMLTLAKDRSLVDKLIILARVFQIKRLSHVILAPGKQVGWRVQPKLLGLPGFKVDKKTEKRCREMEDIIQQVDETVHPNGFIDFAAQYIDLNLTYDRNCMVITRDRQGLPMRYHLVDPTTVEPVIEVLMDYSRKYNRTRDQAYTDIYRESKLDLTDSAYVQVVDGCPVAKWTRDEMAVNITNTSVMMNRWAYGSGSCLEQSLGATQTWLNAWAYNNGLFNQDSPESILLLFGDVDPMGLGAFQRQILDQSGSGDYQKVPVVQADVNDKAQLVKIREIPKDIMFPDLLRMIVQLKAAAYRAHPSIINFSVDKGGGGMTLGNSSEDTLMQEAKEEGFSSICGALAAFITRNIIRPRYDDLVMVFDVDLDDETDRLKRLEIQSKLGLTYNEARAAMALKGDLDPDADPGDMPINPAYVNALQAKAKMKADADQAEEAKKQAKAGQVPGQPPGAPGETPPAPGQDNQKQPEQLKPPANKPPKANQPVVPKAKKVVVPKKAKVPPAEASEKDDSQFTQLGSKLLKKNADDDKVIIIRIFD